MQPLSEQRVLIFVPEFNTEGKKDVTGAFLPEAQKFGALAKEHRIYQFDNSKGMAKRRAEVLEELRNQGLSNSKERRMTATSVAFFCHGWASGIQAGFDNKHVPELADALANCCGYENEEIVVPLYCCSTGDDKNDMSWEAAGSGENSFADRLRDALCDLGRTECRVMAHVNPGHTNQNPYALFMDGMGSTVGGAGGYAVVAPKSPLWMQWKKALRTTDLRHRFPYMTVAEIHAELAK